MNNKIGNFFVSIGRGIKKGFFAVINWIKTTAWIQPLLIVGAIFAVILCINPVSTFIGNLFSPNTTNEFYRQHNANMDTVIETYIDGKEGTSILFFYDDEDSDCQNAEDAIRSFATDNTNINWYCIDTTSTSTEIDSNGLTEQDRLVNSFQDNFFDEYVLAYDKLPSSMKDSAYADELTMAEDDGSNPEVPVPLLARYDDGELIGVKVGVSSTDARKDLDNFIKGDPETDWPSFSI